MRESVIVSAVRTPTGRFLGSLKSLRAVDLGARAVAEAVRRAGIDRALVHECLMGNVIAAGLGQNPARQAALGGGLPDTVDAVTVNEVCGSALKAVMLADRSIRAGAIDIAVAGGMESMSQAPYLLPRVREGLRMGHGEVLDAMIHDGLWCPFEHTHMGVAGEAVAERYGVSRAAQDAWAAASHAKAARAADTGAFADEILPIDLPQKSGPPVRIDRDESIRPQTTVEALAALTPAFAAGGSVTAGNAPGVSDGASAIVLMDGARARDLGLAPLARIVAQASSGLPPKWLLMTPVEATRRVLARAGWTLADVDLIELNEAFSAQAVAVVRELGLDPERVNVHGGAVALGHAIGSTGTRILTTLVYALKRRGLRRGIVTLCMGGGNGLALAVERVS